MGRRGYPPEFRAEAIRLVRTTARIDASRRRYGVSRQAIADW
jgi:transposase-like protein